MSTSFDNVTLFTLNLSIITVKSEIKILKSLFTEPVEYAIKEEI